MLEQLKRDVCKANIELQKQGLVFYSFGNVSGIDHEKGIVAIKPSGVSYDKLTPDRIVLLDLDGKVMEGDLNPSSDTPTHLELYRQFNVIGGICHTHSKYATMWAQACRSLPCFGTTHADYFYDSVPVTDKISKEQIESDYELNTGKIIVERFKDLDPSQMQAVLVAQHGPFTWGKDADKAVENAVVLEEIAQTAIGTVQINPDQQNISQDLLDKHYLRKHGKNAYYGQK
ncbi:MAG TPA: L-ribulose-5-phosphate 4-epimerase [Planctomycetes bacterium]|nr:L-ribulose-5-phosphate 4-epimerase [Planctomycetota bacterium]